MIKGEASQWLTVIPTSRDNFDLSPNEFRDAIAVRYGKEPSGLPELCDGCGVEFSLQHGLDCKKGGLVKAGHDSLRDECAQLAELACGIAIREPIMKEADPTTNQPALIGDIMVRGIWEAGRVAFFDNRIVDADAPSYRNRNMSWDAISHQHAREKHNKYDRAAEDVRGSFTPLICSCEGVFHKEFKSFLKRLSSTLTEKWEKPYSSIFCWVKVRIQISLIRAISMRIRGNRKRIRQVGTEDGAGVHLL